METTFIYNGKTITTPNLEKKLKRMKITLDDITIIDNPEVKKVEDDGIEDYMKDKVKYKIKIGDAYPIFFIKPTDNIEDIVRKYYPDVNEICIVGS